MTRKFVISDIHGKLISLQQCIASVSPTKDDTFIFLGDYVDRGAYSYEVISYLIELAKRINCIFINGNHDDCFKRGLFNNNGDQELFTQGAKETVISYITALKLEDSVSDFKLCAEHIPDDHQQFFLNLKSYYIDEDNNLFVHGGFNRHYPIDQQPEHDIYWWDRDLLHQVRSFHSMKNTGYKFKYKNDFKEIFIGHTPVQHFHSDVPLNYANIHLIDCGAGKFKDGKVCIMDVDTKEYKLF